MSRQQEFITVARIVRPQGRRGEVAAEILTDFPERFAERSRLVLRSDSLGSREVELENFWLHKGRVIFKFTGVNSITQAEALKGSEVQIPCADRAELETGSFYISDLLGCSVWDYTPQPPREIGVIEGVEPGSVPVLNVRQGKRELQIPFAEEYILCVAVEAKRLEMKLPEGLLEINQPLTAEEKQRLKRTRRDEV